MPKKSTLFFTRRAIADHLSISRMTLSRWEKVVRLPNQSRRFRLNTLSEDDITKWKREVYQTFQSQNKRGYCFLSGL